MQLTGPALQGLCHRISISMRVLGIRYKGCGENGTREYGIGAKRTLPAIAGYYILFAVMGSCVQALTIESVVRFISGGCGGGV